MTYEQFVTMIGKVGALFIKKSYKVTVYAFSDDDGERSVGTPNWFFTDKEVAEKTASRRGWYGGNASVNKYDAIIDADSDTVHLIKQSFPLGNLNLGPADKEAKRQAALNKLSPEERKLLGL